jgi:hypothetical protein
MFSQVCTFLDTNFFVYTLLTFSLLRNAYSNANLLAKICECSLCLHSDVNTHIYSEHAEYLLMQLEQSLDFNPVSQLLHLALAHRRCPGVAKSERYATGRTLVRADCIPSARDRRSLSQAQCVRVERGKAEQAHSLTLHSLWAPTDNWVAAPRRKQRRRLPFFTKLPLTPSTSIYRIQPSIISLLNKTLLVLWISTCSNETNFSLTVSQKARERKLLWCDVTYI